MDSLLVDLDKVLDDFEAEENTSSFAPGQELRPSGFSDYLDKHEEHPWKILSETPATVSDQYQNDQPNKLEGSVMYDIPYEPTEKFDISEADFAPSPTPSDKSLNGTSIYDYKNDVASSLSPAHQLYKAEVSEKNLQNQTPANFNGSDTYINDSEQVLRYPVQAADNSPVHVNSNEVRVNGHFNESPYRSPKQQNIDANKLSASEGKVSNLSLASSTEQKDSSDEKFDRFPIQCNTPQTPCDNVNPLDAQIASQHQTMHSIPDTGAGGVGHSVSSEHSNAIRQSDQLGPLPVLTDKTLSNDLAQASAQRGQGYGDVVNSKPDGQGFSSLPVEESATEAVTFASLQNIPEQSRFGVKQDLESHQIGEDTKLIPKSQDVSMHGAIGDSSEQSLSSYNAPSSTTGVGGTTLSASTLQAVIGFGNVDVDLDEADMAKYLEDNTEQNSAPPLGSGIVNADVSVVGVTEQVTTVNVGTQAVTNPVEMVSIYGDIPGQRLDSTDREILNVLPADDDVEVLVTPQDFSDEVYSGQQYNPAQSETRVSDTNTWDMEDGLNVNHEQLTDPGARPKDLQNRPQTLMGLSKVDLNSESLFKLQSPSEAVSGEQISADVCSGGTVVDSRGEHSSPKNGGQLTTCDQVEVETSQLGVMELLQDHVPHVDPQVSSQAFQDIPPSYNLVALDYMTDECIPESGDPWDDNVNPEQVTLRAHTAQHNLPGTPTRPHSWSPSGSEQLAQQRQKRPTSLNLPPRPEFNPNVDDSPLDVQMSPEEAGASGHTGVESEAGTEISTGGGETSPGEEVAGAEGPDIPDVLQDTEAPPPPYSTSLGKVAPKWVPDAEAATCMDCDAKFTFTKRRHHCRACGKIFCSNCCSLKSKLLYMDNKEARVCMSCHHEIAELSEAWPTGRSPYPTNPSDYCSTVPPNQQVNCPASPPTVLVPAGVLKREGTSKRGEPKQVMFSDGIRPGGDLTELDGSAEVTRIPPKRSGRSQKRVEKGQDGQHSLRSRRVKSGEGRTGKCLIPEEGLPPLASAAQSGIGFALQENPDQATLVQQIKDEASPPVMFAVNTNLYVYVKILNLDCCVNRVIWCFSTRGMTSAGQEEMVIALEVIPGEETIPRDVLCHLNNLYEDACKGNTVTDMGHSIFSHSFLGSRDHGGFLYMRATFQCVQKLILPSPPFLFGILLQKWETPWAKVFPIRLLLRLGAEYRYYPCPLIGVRNRKPIFFEIGHTIMNLLADFRNYQYMLPQIRGITIHMEDKKTRINFPRNRYEDLMKVVSSSNEHVMAMGANFSPDADSHLVCIQNDDGNYQTQAINIQNRPRKVTGASFVVFNGALKTSSGLSAKSSIVEDGLMVQITPDSMLALKQSMKDMQSYSINCGSVTAPKPEETVLVQWVDDDKMVNIGVKSPIDKMPMDGIESVHIHHFTDYVGEKSLLRWTEVFFIQNEDNGSSKWDPVDLSRLGETLATACSMAMVQHLDKLKEAGLTKIGLRVNIQAENVGYEAGSKGERLPDVYMNDLDNELIPVIHRALQQSHEGTIVIELIFQILD